MIAVDFFCGGGGLTRGLLDAGIRVILGVDSDENCRETYERNNPPARFLCKDIRILKPEELKPYLKGVKSDDLLFAACAPCQPFTKQRREFSNHHLRSLLGQVQKFVHAFRPASVLVENVPGILKVRGFSAFRRFEKELLASGYKISINILDAKHYGVPQTRRRLILIASRLFQPTPPKPTHGQGRRHFVTVRDAIGKYPPIGAGENYAKIPNHRAASVSATNFKRLLNTPADGGTRFAWPKRLRLECHKEYSGHTDVYGRLPWKRPAPALTCKCWSISNGRYGHPEQNRAISLREAAALQTFRDDYTFYGSSIAHIASQIGNAVAVRMAKASGTHLLGLSNQHHRVRKGTAVMCNSQDFKAYMPPPANRSRTYSRLPQLKVICTSAK
jgi:DNA (cytosine-5)-methyltransferase 1